MGGVSLSQSVVQLLTHLIFGGHLLVLCLHQGIRELTNLILRVLSRIPSGVCLLRFRGGHKRCVHSALLTSLRKLRRMLHPNHILLIHSHSRLLLLGG